MRRRREELVTRGHRIDRATMARISPLPPPEEVFADWLLSLPPDVDIEAAARQQIELIDRRVSFHPDVHCLRMLLVAIAGEGAWQRSSRNL
jgi:hypothetical protein